jgi:hypothetical protein
MGPGEPPALLGAIADRVRAGDLNATTRQLAGELGVDAAKLTAVGNEEMSASNRHAKRLKPFQMASITAQRILV